MILKKLYSSFIVCENRYAFITINSQKVIMGSILRQVAPGHQTA